MLSENCPPRQVYYVFTWLNKCAHYYLWKCNFPMFFILPVDFEFRGHLQHQTFKNSNSTFDIKNTRNGKNTGLLQDILSHSFQLRIKSLIKKSSMQLKENWTEEASQALLIGMQLKNTKKYTLQFFNWFLILFLSNQNLKGAKTCLWVLLLVPATSVNNVTNKAGLCSKSIKCITNQHLSTLHW